MTISKRIFHVLVAMVAVFAASGIYLTDVNRRTTDAMSKAARYDLSWSCMRTKAELASLGQAVGLYVVDPKPAHLAALRLQADIVVGRAEGLRLGEFGKLIREGGVLATQMNAYIAGASALDHLATTHPTAETLRAASHQIHKLHENVELACTTVQQQSAAAMERAQDDLRSAHAAALGLISGLLVAGCVLVSLLVIQNRATMDAYGRQRDISSKYEHMANHDVLTGLPNRAKFFAQLQHELAAPAASPPLAVLTLDLDRFKVINDTLGHEAGDKLLTSVAGRLAELQAMGVVTLMARLGGDEFIALVTGPDAAAAARAAAEAIIDRIAEPHPLDGHTVMVRATVGIALAEPGVDTAMEAARHSDIALSWAKNRERGTWCLFDGEMDKLLHDRRRLEVDLVDAIRRNEFEVHYQPFVDIASTEIRGVEALLRWRHPTLGLISPSVFVPIAEETGLIVAIGRLVLNEASRDAMRMPPHWRVAVNLSAVQFLRDDLLFTIEEVLQATGLEPSRLELEITESVMLGDERKVHDVLQSLRKLGIQTALDDFGTGFSSLSYLRRFGFSKLKIDQSFVRIAKEDARGQELIRSIVNLGRSLDLVVTAEGLETPEQWAALRAAGCTYGQGYLFGRPMPIDLLLETGGVHRKATDATGLAA